MKKIELSIVTVTLNDLSGLKSTLASILEQESLLGYERMKSCIEWVVVDGGSSDGTKEFLQGIDLAINFQWISEKDKGIFDAMNKGARLSTGGYLLYLNAGDKFVESSVLGDFLPLLKENQERIVAGLVKMIWRDHVKTSDLSPWVCQQSVFVPRSVFSLVSFDADLRFFGDLSFWKELKKREKFDIIRVNKIVSEFQMGGVGNRPDFIFRRVFERQKVGKKYGDKIPSVVRLLDASIRYSIWKILGLNAYYRFTMR